MPKVYVYDSYDNKFFRYTLRENDPMPYSTGTTLRVRKEPEAIREALKYEGRLLTIHSQEPDLKTIFLQLTGRDLR